MKFLAVVAVAASSLVAMASADLLQIKNPTQGSVWTAGKKMTVSWSGNCKNMGEAGRNVTVDLVTGPPEALRWSATLGVLNCAGKKKSASFNIPRSSESGSYTVIVRTAPQPSFSYSFQIKGR